MVVDLLGRAHHLQRVGLRQQRPRAQVGHHGVVDDRQSRQIQHGDVGAVGAAHHALTREGGPRGCRQAHGELADVHQPVGDDGVGAVDEGGEDGGHCARQRGDPAAHVHRARLADADAHVGAARVEDERRHLVAVGSRIRLEGERRALGGLDALDRALHHGGRLDARGRREGILRGLDRCDVGDRELVAGVDAPAGDARVVEGLVVGEEPRPVALEQAEHVQHREGIRPRHARGVVARHEAPVTEGRRARQVHEGGRALLAVGGGVAVHQRHVAQRAEQRLDGLGLQALRVQRHGGVGGGHRFVDARARQRATAYRDQRSKAGRRQAHAHRRQVSHGVEALRHADGAAVHAIGEQVAARQREGEAAYRVVTHVDAHPLGTHGAASQRALEGRRVAREVLGQHHAAAPALGHRRQQWHVRVVAEGDTRRARDATGSLVDGRQDLRTRPLVVLAVAHEDHVGDVAGVGLGGARHDVGYLEAWLLEPREAHRL